MGDLALESRGTGSARYPVPHLFASGIQRQIDGRESPTPTSDGGADPALVASNPLEKMSDGAEVERVDAEPDEIFAQPHQIT